MCEISNAFGAVGGDDEMCLASLSGELRQERPYDAFVVGVSEDGEDRSAVLSRRRVRDDRGQGPDQEGVNGNAHANRVQPGRLTRETTPCLTLWLRSILSAWQAD